MRRILVFLKIIPAVLILLSSVGSSHGEPFTIARVKYSGGGDWYGDPSSLVNLQRFLHETTVLEVSEREAVVNLTDDDLFSYPYLYMTGHGNVNFSDEEAERLREYLLGGGFMHVDDNYGLDKYFRREIKKVFPDRELEEVPYSNPIYHIAFDFPNGLPKIHEHNGKPAQGFAITVDGRIVLFYSYECDLGDGWEDPDVHHDPPEKRLAALRMGVNIILYALSGSPLTLP